LLDVAGVWSTMLDVAGVWRTLLDVAGVWSTMLDVAGLDESDDVSLRQARIIGRT